MTTTKHKSHPLMTFAVWSMAFAGALSSTHARADIDLTSQDISVEDLGENLRIVTIASGRTTSPTSSMLIYHPPMAVVSVTVNDVAATISPYPGYTGLISTLQFPSSLGTGTVVEIALELEGVPNCASYAGPQYDGCVYTDDTLVLAPAGPGQGWYFSNLNDVDVFTGTVSVTAHSSRTIVAGQGAPVDVTTVSLDQTETTFEFNVPTENVGVIAREFHVATAGGARPVSIHHSNIDDQARMQAAAERAVAVRDVFEARYVPLPFDDVRYTLFPGIFPFAGMGMIGSIWFAEYLLDDQFTEIFDQGIGHELGHTWWGGLTSSGEYASGPFFNEAMAEYAAWAAVGDLDGDDARMRGVRMNSVWYMYGRPGDADHAIVDNNVTDSPVYVHVTYHKGSSVLRSLEEKIGANRFDAVLRAQIARGPGGTSIDTLIDDTFAIAAVDISADVDQWLYGTGFPTLHASAASENDVTTVHIDVDGVPTFGGAFHFSIPIVIHHQNGSVETVTPDVHSGANDVTLDVANPLLIEIDPHWTLVRAIHSQTDDVTFDGVVDGRDVLEVMWRVGGEIPSARREDGAYDPLYDLDDDGDIDAADVALVSASFAP